MSERGNKPFEQIVPELLAANLKEQKKTNALLEKILNPETKVQKTVQKIPPKSNNKSNKRSKHGN